MEKEQFKQWVDELATLHIPRWSEFPTIDIYMDQLVTLADRYTGLLQPTSHNRKAVTPSMVNNYVKQGLMPKPIKKKYNQQHIAYLVVITILKQNFDIPQIKTAISWQTNLSDSETAYDQFCQQIEDTIHYFVIKNQDHVFGQVELAHTPLEMACLSLVTKLFAEQALALLTGPLQPTANPALN